MTHAALARSSQQIVELVDAAGTGEFRSAFLDLVGAPLSSVDISALCWGLACQSSIVSVNLSRVALGAAGAAELGAYIGSARELRTLILRHCDIPDSGATALLEAVPREKASEADDRWGGSGAGGTHEAGHGLRTVDLSHNPIGERTAAVLADLLRANQCPLRTLVLDNTKIGDRGAALIADALGRNESLVFFSARHCKLGFRAGNALVTHLVRNRELVHCRLEYNAISSVHERSIHSVLDRNRRTLNRQTVDACYYVPPGELRDVPSKSRIPRAARRGAVVQGAKRGRVSRKVGKPRRNQSRATGPSKPEAVKLVREGRRWRPADHREAARRAPSRAEGTGPVHRSDSWVGTLRGDLVEESAAVARASPPLSAKSQARERRRMTRQSSAVLLAEAQARAGAHAVDALPEMPASSEDEESVDQIEDLAGLDATLGLGPRPPPTMAPGEDLDDAVTRVAVEVLEERRKSRSRSISPRPLPLLVPAHAQAAAAIARRPSAAELAFGGTAVPQPIVDAPVDGDDVVRSLVASASGGSSAQRRESPLPHDRSDVDEPEPAQLEAAPLPRSPHPLRHNGAGVDAGPAPPRPPLELPPPLHRLGRDTAEALPPLPPVPPPPLPPLPPEAPAGVASAQLEALLERLDPASREHAVVAEAMRVAAQHSPAVSVGGPSDAISRASSSLPDTTVPRTASLASSPRSVSSVPRTGRTAAPDSLPVPPPVPPPIPPPAPSPAGSPNGDVGGRGVPRRKLRSPHTPALAAPRAGPSAASSRVSLAAEDAGRDATVSGSPPTSAAPSPVESAARGGQGGAAAPAMCAGVEGGASGTGAGEREPKLASPSHPGAATGRSKPRRPVRGSATIGEGVPALRRTSAIGEFA